MREGPEIRVKTTRSCQGCIHNVVKKWSIEDGNDYDWGFDHHCAKMDGKYIGQNYDTPSWCPFVQEEP